MAHSATPAPASSLSDLRPLLDALGLGHLASALQAAALPSARLVPSGANPVIGGSRIGGLPDLPAHVPWPTWGDTPLAFVAPLDCATLAPCDPQGLLPAAGRLLFFYDAFGQSPWGYDPRIGRDYFRIVYDAGPLSGLSRRYPPNRLARLAARHGVHGGAFPQAGVTVLPSLSVPPLDAPAINRLLGLPAMDAGDEETYHVVRETLARALDTDAVPVPVHRVLGYPEPIQHPMLTELQAVATHGIYWGGSGGPPVPEHVTEDMLAAGAEDWQLLLQLDSDPGTGMEWGHDHGRLYFWIRKDDLRARRFDRAWCILQCY